MSNPLGGVSSTLARPRRTPVTDPVTIIAGLFDSEGAADYLGEPVTQAAPPCSRQPHWPSGTAPGALVIAALLHDVGHFTAPSPART